MIAFWFERLREVSSGRLRGLTTAPIGFGGPEDKDFGELVFLRGLPHPGVVRLVEMTDWDRQWQDRITKVVRRVARDLIANDEAEIGDVVRRRLFEDLGSERVRKRVSKMYADWCFERTARLPSEWMAVDSATTEAKA